MEKHIGYYHYSLYDAIRQNIYMDQEDRVYLRNSVPPPNTIYKDIKLPRDIIDKIKKEDGKINITVTTQSPGDAGRNGLKLNPTISFSSETPVRTKPPEYEIKNPYGADEIYIDGVKIVTDKNQVYPVEHKLDPKIFSNLGTSFNTFD